MHLLDEYDEGVTQATLVLNLALDVVPVVFDLQRHTCKLLALQAAAHVQEWTALARQAHKFATRQQLDSDLPWWVVPHVQGQNDCAKGALAQLADLCDKQKVCQPVLLRTGSARIVQRASPAQSACCRPAGGDHARCQSCVLACLAGLCHLQGSLCLQRPCCCPAAAGGAGAWACADSSLSSASLNKET